MKFDFHGKEKGFREGVLFLCGRGKSIESWNLTSTGQQIDLELGFRERVQTGLVEFSEEDIERPNLTPLIEQLDPSVKWLIVASSLGGWSRGSCTFCRRDIVVCTFSSREEISILKNQSTRKDDVSHHSRDSRDPVRSTYGLL